MATREQKKNKLKALKQKQQENRDKNRQKVEEEINKTQQIIWDEESYNSPDKYPTSIKESVLVLLKDIIKELMNNNNNDLYIKVVAKSLYDLAINPTKSYSQMISVIISKTSNNKMIKALNKSLNKPKCKLNNTERALLKSQMQSILAEYIMVNGIYDLHDYGAMRVAFEVAYLAISNGLKEKHIKSLTLNVKYGDKLDSIELEYNDGDQKYNLNDNILIFPIWNSLDTLYHYFSIYRTDYGDFSQESINSLATAKDMDDKFKEREQGQEIISYKGIAMNYLGVLEEELKNLISISFKIDKRSITFNDAINYLEKKHFDNLSDGEVIQSLHEMRRLRNKAAHPGETITSNDIRKIETKLINGQILKFLDWNLKEHRFKKCN